MEIEIKHNWIGAKKKAYHFILISGFGENNFLCTSMGLGPDLPKASATNEFRYTAHDQIMKLEKKFRDFAYGV